MEILNFPLENYAKDEVIDETDYYASPTTIMGQ